ncbi:TetR/AcrR family transcriptional regulator [Limnochorda pilosa]|uniref:HTH tetR-type domain-containing protein n=1 Tax=Limnochorda pilosa TaxID=1555112 RepID=A0A0K2SHB4_LIMPI|nr:TetR/AcrR family transcriptional regulator [Limnochorda pilosa]BAS26508.1 hypothetical protein LIP_0651 [Limnochorda pilosa]
MNRKESIVAAAYRCFSRDGYDATSLRAVAAEADISPGHLHYYFRRKEDLALAALEWSMHGQHLQALRDELKGVTSGQERVPRLLEAVRRRRLAEPGWFRLVADLWVHGAQREPLREAVAALYRGLRQAVLEEVQVVAPDLPPPEAQVLAGVIQAFFDGLDLQYQVAPNEVDLDAAYGLLEWFLLRLGEPAGGGAGQGTPTGRASGGSSLHPRRPPAHG